MARVVIELDLDDADAAAFEGQDVVVAVPTTKAEYLDFLAKANTVGSGVEGCLAIVGKMESSGGVTGKAVEGLHYLTTILGHMLVAERALQDFFAKSKAVPMRPPVRKERLQ